MGCAVAKGRVAPQPLAVAPVPDAKQEPAAPTAWTPQPAAPTQAPAKLKSPASAPAKVPSPKQKKPAVLRPEDCGALASEIARKPQPLRSLVKVVKTGDLPKLRQMLQEGDCGIDSVGMWGNTPLISACSYGFVDVAKELLKAGANATAKNEVGATALHYAAAEGLKDLAETLIEHKASPCVGAANLYHRHLDGYFELPPLAIAAQNGFVEIAEVFLAAGAELDAPAPGGETALWCAARYGHAACVKFLLAKGALAKPKGEVGVVEAACLRGAPSGDKKLRGQQCAKVLRALLGASCDANASGAPLVECVDLGHLEALEVLLQHGCRVDTKSAQGRTALHAACEKKSAEALDLLLARKADATQPDPAGILPADILTRGNADPELIARVQAAARRGHDQDVGAGTGES